MPPTATSTPPRRSNARKAAPKVEETTVVVEPEATDAESTLVRTTYELDNRGRTKNGEGKQVYWNLHEKGARGQIFTDPDVVAVKILVVRNTAAVVE